MALKTKHSDVYRDSWKPLLQRPVGDKPIRRKGRVDNRPGFVAMLHYFPKLMHSYWLYAD